MPHNYGEFSEVSTHKADYKRFVFGLFVSAMVHLNPGLWFIFYLQVCTEKYMQIHFLGFFLLFFIVRAYAVIPCIHTNISVSFGCHLCQWWCVPSRQNSCLLQVTGTTKCVFLRCTFQPGSCLFQVKGRLKSAFLSPLLFSPVAHRGGCDKEKGTQADC